MAVTAYLGLGSNLGDRAGSIKAALEQLDLVPGIEAGGAGASYAEEADPGRIVRLADGEVLRTIVEDPNQLDLGSGSVVTPITSFMVGHLEARLAQEPGAEVMGQWRESRGAINAHFGLRSADTVRPRPPQFGGRQLTPGLEYGMLLAGLSQMAVQMSGQSPDLDSRTLWRALEQDLAADGCWDGKGVDGQALDVGGGQMLSSRSVRIDLAMSTASFMQGPENPTAFNRPGDAVGLLDRVSLAGPRDPNDDPSRCEPGTLVPDGGSVFGGPMAPQPGAPTMPPPSP